jgi:iron complex outermembrane receptor protein
MAPLDNLDVFAGGTLTWAEPGDLPNTPFATAVAGVTYAHGNWRFNVDAQWSDERYVQGTRFGDKDALVHAFFLLNARVGYTFKLPREGMSLEVFSAVENLTDGDYEYRPGYPMPGMAWTFGMNFRF